MAHKESRYAGAKKAYLDILKETPDSGLTLNALGYLYLDRARPDKVKRIFEKAANLRPPNLTACYTLGRLMRIGIITFSVEKLEEKSAGYRLFPNGRFAHSQTHIEYCLKHHGLELLEKTESVLRKQSGDEVKGILIAAKKGRE